MVWSGLVEVYSLEHSKLWVSGWMGWMDGSYLEVQLEHLALLIKHFFLGEVTGAAKGSIGQNHNFDRKLAKQLSGVYLMSIQGLIKLFKGEGRQQMLEEHPPLRPAPSL